MFVISIPPKEKLTTNDDDIEILTYTREIHNKIIQK